MTLPVDVWRRLKHQPHKEPRVGQLFRRPSNRGTSTWEPKYGTLVETLSVTATDFLLSTGVYYQHRKMQTIMGEYFVLRLNHCVYYEYADECRLTLLGDNT